MFNYYFKIEWGMAHQIATGVANSGSFTFNTVDHRCDNSRVEDYGMGKQPVQVNAPSKPIPKDGRPEYPNAPTPTTTHKTSMTTSLYTHTSTPSKFSSTTSGIQAPPVERDPISAASTNAASSCDWKVGAIKVSMTANGVTPERSRGLWTTAIPLGWYSMPTSDSVEMCDTWYEENEASRGADNTLLVCPCTYDQAMAEGSGRFTVDPDCTGDDGSCYWNPGSTLCLISSAPS